ncbi:MAG: hypothetical protein K2M41_06855 [Muribaculaceae bacterium]|nr:hypothetical protein [Muribaculaceae bacterium]
MLTIILPAFVVSAIKIMLVALIIIGMIFLHVGISKLSNVDEHPDSHAAEHLREDVAESRDVITEDSVFHNFLARTPKSAKD